MKQKAINTYLKSWSKLNVLLLIYCGLKKVVKMNNYKYKE